MSGCKIQREVVNVWMGKSSIEICNDEKVEKRYKKCLDRLEVDNMKEGVVKRGYKKDCARQAKEICELVKFVVYSKERSGEFKTIRCSEAVKKKDIELCKNRK